MQEKYLQKDCKQLMSNTQIFIINKYNRKNYILYIKSRKVQAKK